MSNHIVEEGPHKGHAAGDSDLEKQASQLASDVRYKVRKAMGSGSKMSPAQVSRAYLAQLAKSPAPGAVKSMAKKKLMGEAYGSDIENVVEESVSKKVSKIFSENYVKPEPVQQEIVDESLGDEKKYMIVVKDKETGNTYRRKATRAKIAELRANPNIASVEMTHYGKVTDDEAKSGKKTAAAKAGKDYDGDGKVESGAKEYRGAVHNAIQRKKGGKADGKDTSSVKEEFIGEVKESEDDSERKITGKGVNNYKGKNTVVNMSPSIGEQAASAEAKKTETGPSPEEKKQIELKKRMLQKKMMLQKQAMQMQKQGRLPLNYSEENDQLRYCPKCDKDETREECKYGGEYWDENSKPAKAEDPRGMKAKVNMVRNKLRAMGLKMSHVPEGEMVEDADLDKMQKDADANRARAAKLKDRNVTRGSAALAARAVERDVKKAAKTGPQQYPNPGKGVKKIEKPKPTHTKTGAMRVEGLSVDKQMEISKKYNRMSPEEKRAANMKVLGNIKKVAAKKDTRTDAQKMTDATGPRPGSRYRGD